MPFTIDKKKRKNGLILVILATYIGIMMLLFNVSYVTMMRFIVLNVVSVFLPGVAILCITSIQVQKIAALCYAYAFGNAVVILEYFVSEIFNRMLSFSAITTGVAILSCIFMYQKVRTGEEIIQFTEEKVDFDLILFIASMFFSVFVYSYRHCGTDVVNAISFTRDMQYWCNNAVALKIAFPPSNLFMEGIALEYHYFSNIPIAFLSTVYNIDVFTLSFPLYSFSHMFLMTGAALSLLNVLKIEGVMRLWGGILILFTTGIEHVVK